MTSESFTAPTALWMTLTRTSSVPMRERRPLMGSREPFTSALRTTLSSLILPSLMAPRRDSIVVGLDCAASSRSRDLERRVSAMPRALFVSSTT